MNFLMDIIYVHGHGFEMAKLNRFILVAIFSNKGMASHDGAGASIFVDI